MPSNALAAGYRLFFLLAAVNAWSAMAPWLFMLAGGAVPTQGWPPHTLHAHEMLYGTVVPVIAGFLLTAVPNWTDSKPVTGRPLLALVALWVAGRVALVLAGPIDPAVVAVVDIAFLPALALVVGIPIVRAGAHRHLPVVAVLLGLAVANGAIHLGLRDQRPDLLRSGTFGAVYLIVVLMLIVGGRLIPLFTRNALARRGEAIEMPTRRGLGAVAIGLAIGALAADLADPGGRGAAALALAASPLLFVRQAAWAPRRALRDPMLWILHLGHAWIALGFALQGLALLSLRFVGAGALHAFTAGAMGTLTLGMMTRVALGHSGRPIVASPAIVGMFALAIAGALLRVAGAATSGVLYRPAVLSGGVLWSAAWLAYCIAMGRILLGPRVDAPAASVATAPSH